MIPTEQSGNHELVRIFDLLTSANLATDSIQIRALIASDEVQIARIAVDEKIWQYTTNAIHDVSAVRVYMSQALADLRNRIRVPFVAIEKKSGNLLGSSSIGNISVKDERAEIGWSWLGIDYQGKGFNSEFKYLLLKLCFETLHLKRVEFKTDVLNLRSRQALKKIGAREEGILRSHTLMHDGRRRDTIYYSILDTEWPTLSTSMIRNGNSKSGPF